MRIQALMDESFQIAEEHGFHEIQDVWTFLGNIHCEISEAWEEARKNEYPLDKVYTTSQHPGKPEGFPIELADAVIRIADTCKALGIDLEGAIKMKMEYNKTRPFRHGGKLC